MTTPAQLTAALTAASFPMPTSSFLTSILTPTPSTSSTSFSRAQPPLPALLATAKHRLLSYDLTLTPSILSSSTSFLPPNISHVKIAASVLEQDVFVQVLDVIDVGRSKWEQIELLEAERKGEMTKGREIIRVAAQAENGAEPSSASTQFPTQTNNAAQASKGPFKLLLQDWKGTTVWAFELKKVEGIAGLSIGGKMLLRRGSRIARGTVLLETGKVVVFGGKIEVRDKVWREGREARLRAEVVAEREGGSE